MLSTPPSENQQRPSQERLTNAILSIVLIPRYGIEGAAIATKLSFFVYNGIEVGLIYK